MCAVQNGSLEHMFLAEIRERERDFEEANGR